MNCIVVDRHIAYIRVQAISGSRQPKAEQNGSPAFSNDQMKLGLTRGSVAPHGVFFLAGACFTRDLATLLEQPALQLSASVIIGVSSRLSWPTTVARQRQDDQNMGRHCPATGNHGACPISLPSTATPALRA